MARKKESPQKAAMREIMHSYLKENDNRSHRIPQEGTLWHGHIRQYGQTTFHRQTMIK